MASRLIVTVILAVGIWILWMQGAASAASATPASCVGDCNGDNDVRINELILGIHVLLGDAPLSTCPAIDCPQPLELVINCAIEAVANALNGCSPPTPHVPTATPTSTATC